MNGIFDYIVSLKDLVKGIEKVRVFVTYTEVKVNPGVGFVLIEVVYK